MKQLLIKLRNLLQCNLFYISLLFLTCIFVLLNICFRTDKSIYSGNETNFILEVDEYNFDGNKLSLELNNKEKLVGTYYIDNYEELLYLKDNLKYGSKLEIVGSLNIPSNNTVPNTFNYKNYLNNNDIYYTLSIDSLFILDNKGSIVDTIRNFIKRRIDKIDSTGYMDAFILGNKDNIDKDIYDNYQLVGITHLFALSGMHIGLLSTIILKFIKCLSEGKKYFIISVILVVYGFIVGFPSSIKRCILFFIINSLNKYFKLDISSFKVLLIVIFSLIIYNYKIIYDVGFIYSVVTVGGIILCNNYINSDNKLVSSFRLSIVAFLFSLPITLYNFYEINLLSIFYNMIFIPYVSIVVYPLSLLSFLVPSLSFIFSMSIELLELSCGLLSDIKLFVIYLDFNILEVLVFYIVILLMFYKSIKFSFILVFIILLDLYIPYLDSNAYVYFFDVGQGDSILIITPNRKEVILIDTGGVINYTKEKWMEKSSYNVSLNVISFMKSIGIKSISKLIISHGDFDHMGEVDNYLDDFKIDKVIFNCGDFSKLESDFIKKLKQRNISYSNCNYFLSNKIYDNENDNSIVVYRKLYNYKFLFMGDASTKVENDLINEYHLQDIDVLKLGHHGSKTSTGEEFISEVRPKYSIISVGKNNRFGHPNDNVLENLEESKIYRTDQDGSIMFKINNSGFKIKTFAP